ncbi:hypothetical protein LguiA_030416 [Lonicera macranthoides]
MSISFGAEIEATEDEDFRKGVCGAGVVTVIACTVEGCSGGLMILVKSDTRVLTDEGREVVRRKVAEMWEEAKRMENINNGKSIDDDAISNAREIHCRNEELQILDPRTIIVNQIEPLTEQQLLGLCGLQQSTQEAEEALSQGLDALNQSLSDTIASDSLSCTPNMANYMGQMALAMNKLSTLEGFVRQHRIILEAEEEELIKGMMDLENKFEQNDYDRT